MSTIRIFQSEIQFSMTIIHKDYAKILIFLRGYLPGYEYNVHCYALSFCENVFLRFSGENIIVLKVML